MRGHQPVLCLDPIWFGIHDGAVHRHEHPRTGHLAEPAAVAARVPVEAEFPQEEWHVTLDFDADGITDPHEKLGSVLFELRMVNPRPSGAAAERLIERGCSNIGHVAGPADMTAAVDRREGWRTAMEAAGLRSDLVADGDFTETGGEAATAALLEQCAELDGLVVASDLMAVGAVRVLDAAGRRIPDDVAVVGYDDLGVAERITPALTTIRQPIADMARRAVALLGDELRGGRTGKAIKPTHVTLGYTLVRRQSDAAPGLARGAIPKRARKDD